MKNLVTMLLGLSVILGVTALGAVAADPASTTTGAPIAEIEGEIVKVVPAEREIYVRADDKKHEFYFNPKTTVARGVAPSVTPGTFEDLTIGMRVRVTAHKYGKRLDPTNVTILE
jgi:hypothetical protein